MSVTTIYDMDYAIEQQAIIQNRADVINEMLSYGYPSSGLFPAEVRYPRGGGHGEFLLCGHALFRWRRYDLDELAIAMAKVDAINDFLWVLFSNVKLFTF